MRDFFGKQEFGALLARYPSSSRQIDERPTYFAFVSLGDLQLEIANAHISVCDLMIKRLPKLTLSIILRSTIWCL